MCGWVACCCGQYDVKFPASELKNRSTEVLCSQLEHCPTCFLRPPSHSACGCFLSPAFPPIFTHIACFTLSTTVRQEVCHITCACLQQQECVGDFSQDAGTLQMLTRLKPKWYDLWSPVWTKIRWLLHLIIFSKQHLICCTGFACGGLKCRRWYIRYSIEILLQAKSPKLNFMPNINNKGLSRYSIISIFPANKLHEQYTALLSNLIITVWVMKQAAAWGHPREDHLSIEWNKSSGQKKYFGWAPLGLKMKVWLPH